MKDKQKDYTSADIIQLLRKKYNVDAVSNGNHPTLLFEQVADATGFSAGRWIDAAVFEMWPSQGLTRSAFEIKISRADFLRELNNPLKFQWCWKYFHEFWYVAPKDVIKIEELPSGAGWLYPAGKHLVTARHASHNHNPSLDDKILASFMRSAVKQQDSAVKRARQEDLAADEGYSRAKLFESAVKRFLEQRNSPIPLGVPIEESIFKALEEATMDKKLKADLEFLKDVSEGFKQDMADLFNLFAVIASKSILAKDEMDKKLLQRWGKPVDKYGLKQLKNNDYAKRYIQIIETLMEWEKL